MTSNCSEGGSVRLFVRRDRRLHGGQDIWFVANKKQGTGTVNISGRTTQLTNSALVRWSLDIFRLQSHCKMSRAPAMGSARNDSTFWGWIQ
jgi:hypothetical protein